MINDIYVHFAVYYIATSPYVKAIPAELQDPFEIQCMEKMMAKYKIYDITEEYTTNYNCLYVVAKKAGEPQKAKALKTKRLRDRFSLPNLQL